jgi:ABC-type iron transport system FetAB ATPase subunit
MVLTRRIQPLTPEELQRLTIDRLLAYRSKLLLLENTIADSDYTDSTSKLDISYIWFKDDPKWQLLYDDVLAELARKQT